MTDTNEPRHAAKDPVTINGDIYDKLQSFVRVVGPALITFYLFVGHAYGWSNVELNAGVAGAFLVFMGVLVTWLSSNFKKVVAAQEAEKERSYDGAIFLTDDPATQTVATGFKFNESDPRALIGKNEIRLKVNPNQ